MRHFDHESAKERRTGTGFWVCDFRTNCARNSEGHVLQNDKNIPADRNRKNWSAGIFGSKCRRSLSRLLQGLFQHTEFLADFDECGDALVEVFALVCCGNLYADAGLTLGNDGIEKSGDIDAFLLKCGGETLREGSVVEHDGADGALCGLDVESGLQHLVAEIVDVFNEFIVEGVALAEDIEGLDGGTDNRRRDAVGEKIRTTALAKHVDDLLSTGGEASDSAAECLAKCAGIDVDTPVSVVEFAYTVARCSDHSGGMALVDHDECVIFLGKFADLVHRSDVSVHGEHAIGDDNAEALCLRGLKLALKVFHVGVGITVADGLAEAYTVDDGGVVEGVADDGVVLGEQGFEHTTVGIEAGSIEDGVLSVEVFADGCFELLVQVLASADETYARHTVTAAVHGVLCGLDEAGIIGKAKIIVGTEVENCLPADADCGLLGAFDETFVLVKAGFADGSKFILEILLEVSVHGE